MHRELHVGTVVHLTLKPFEVRVCFNRMPEIIDFDEFMSLVLVPDSVTSGRVRAAVRLLGDIKQNVPLRSVLDNSQPLKVNYDRFPTLLNRDCNFSQEDAVICAYQNEEICTIQGPPGTGKTSTLVYCLLEELQSKKRVLACAPSNNAADNIAERFLKLGCPEEKVLRIAHPTKVREEIHHLLLD